MKSQRIHYRHRVALDLETSWQSKHGMHKPCTLFPLNHLRRGTASPAGLLLILRIIAIQGIRGVPVDMMCIEMQLISATSQSREHVARSARSIAESVEIGLR